MSDQIPSKCNIIEARVETLGSSVDRIERVLEKVAENNTQLTTLCAQYHAQGEMSGERMSRIEDEHDRHHQQFDMDKVEFNHTVRRLHEKIENSEEKSEAKIDYAIEKLSTQIETHSRESHENIAKLTERFERIEKLKWIVVGGSITLGALFAKFEIVKTLFNL